MNPSIAAYYGTTAIYWSAVIIVLGVAAGFLLSYSIYTAHSGRGTAMLVLLPFTLFIGVLLSRAVHFYCNQEQYGGLWQAMTEYSSGSFWLPGAVLAVLPAALIVKAARITDNAGEMLDAAAPGMALTAAMIRFSALFSTSCRSMFQVKARAFQKYPFASADVDAAGNTSYHFASFYILGILMLLVMLLSVIFYYRHHADRMKEPCKRRGNVARLTFVLFCACELVLDSTRADSTYMLFSVLQFLNKYASFISLTQLFCAIGMLWTMICYSRYSARANGKKRIQTVLWGIYLAGLVGTGISEYLVQRYTNKALLCYALQSIAVLASAAAIFIMYGTCRAGKNSGEEEF